MVVLSQIKSAHPIARIEKYFSFEVTMVAMVSSHITIYKRKLKLERSPSLITKIKIS